MRVMVTGAWGIVGREVVPCLAAAGHEVLAFDVRSRQAMARYLKLGKAIRQRVTPFWASITDIEAVNEACEGIDAVIHLAAIIPPAADARPLKAYYVNVVGTELLLERVKHANPGAFFLFSSSIAIYGDRVRDPWITVSDPLHPGAMDYYAQQKLAAEELVRSSGLRWTICRLSYIVSPDKLQMDPLMFAMPLETSLEVCHSRDLARAFLNALSVQGEVEGRTLHMAGGPSCRTNFREYLKRMFECFGLGSARVPEALFSQKGYHCGFMDTEESQRLLRFQSTNLDDYYREVAARVRLLRPLVTLVRPLVRAWVYSRSPSQAKGRKKTRRVSPVNTAVEDAVRRMGILMQRGRLLGRRT